MIPRLSRLFPTGLNLFQQAMSPTLRHASQRNRLPGRGGRQAVKESNDEADGCKQEANEGLLKRGEARYVAWLLAER